MVNDDKSELKEAVRDLTRSAQAALAAHPAVERLIEYRSGTMPPEAEESLRDHLTVCHHCRELVLDLGRFSDLDPRVHRPEPDDPERRWERLRQRLADAAPPESAAAAPSDRWPPHRFAWALAAGLAAAVIGLSLWVQALRHETSELSRPQLNTHLGDLFADEDRLRQGGSLERVEIPPEAELIVLILNLSSSRDFPDYRVEILETVGDQTRVRWRSAGLRRGPEGNFTLTLRRDFLPPGRYRIRILGLEGESGHPLATYAVEIAASPLDPAG